ncbi:MAG: hypothetical protein JST65_07895 [Acidobacteria bacterium]|nr:hypothetical protein [Acidobacteriota bacterium]
MQISLPDPFKDDDDRLEAFLNESLNDDEETRELTPAEWADIRDEAMTAFQARP